MSARILVLEDDDSLRLVLSKALSGAGHAVRATASADTAMTWVQRGEGDVLLADVLLDGHSFLDRLPQITRLKPDLPIIVMSAQTTAGTALDAAREGVFEYLPKPFDIDVLIDTVADALTSRNSATERGGGGDGTGLVGRSAAMQAVYKALGRAAQSSRPVLVVGETGVGKRCVGETVLRARGRSGRPVLVTAGHDRARLMASVEAPQGALWLRLETWPEDLVAFANAALDVATNDVVATVTGARADRLDTRLLTRLGGQRIEIPPLRHRADDIPVLVQHFRQRSDGAAAALGEAVIERLKGHGWPGNVAELEALVERAGTGPWKVRQIEALIDSPAHRPEDAAEAWSTAALAAGLDRSQTLDAVDAALMRQALRESRGNRSKAAKRLGISRNTLARRVVELGISGDPM
ncbi:sigma-54-dependent transcriptional regulator [Maricaulis sp. CAU 1757]